MRVTVDKKDLFSLSDLQKKVIKNDIRSDVFESDMIRRMKYIVEHPCIRHCEQNFINWNKLLRSQGVSSAPADLYSLAEVVLKDKMSLPSLSVQVDGADVFVVSPIERKLLRESVTSDCEKYCKEQIQWILMHKYERCMERLRKDWTLRLSNKGISSIPTDDDEFASLVFSQVEYKDRLSRDQ